MRCIRLSKSRAENVLDTKIVLINEMKKEFNMSWDKLSNLLEKYNILPYIDMSYEVFNSMGIKGIMLDIKNFIREQGGTI